MTDVTDQGKLKSLGIGGIDLGNVIGPEIDAKGLEIDAIGPEIDATGLEIGVIGPEIGVKTIEITMKNVEMIKA